MSVLFNRVWRHLKGVNRSGMVRVSGSAIIGSSGAVTSYDSPGFKIQKNDGQTGRYRIQLLGEDGVTYAVPAMVYSGTTVVAPFGFQDFNVSVVSAQTASALTTDSALKWAIRNYTPQNGYFEMQFYRDVTSSTSETHTDTNIESGGKFFIAFSVKTSSVTP
jgi:hypothetical protein